MSRAGDLDRARLHAERAVAELTAALQAWGLWATASASAPSSAWRSLTWTISACSVTRNTGGPWMLAAYSLRRCARLRRCCALAFACDLNPQPHPPFTGENGAPGGSSGGLGAGC